MSTDLEKQKIRAAINTLRTASLPLTTSSITSQLTDFIVDSYDLKTSLKIYKAAWLAKISSVLVSEGIKFNKTRPNWETIAFKITDKILGIEPTPTEFMPNHNRASNSSASSTRIISDTTTTNEDATTTTTTTTDITKTTDTSTTKQPKLSNSDKLKIQKVFDSLNEENMWVLSTGTIVEKKMEALATSCNYEHPVHSMILDVSDPCWKNHFTDNELKEIRAYNFKKLEDMPDSLSNYIQSIKQANSLSSLKDQLASDQDCTACEWFRRTLKEYIHLFDCGYLPLTNQSEGDMLRRVWFFVDTVFDYSKIVCRGGEKASRSSSSTRNIERALATETSMERKAIGRKVDMVYFRQSAEYGCCECGRDENQTKELYDGSFKMVKVLKDNLFDIYDKAPSSIRNLSAVGFLLFDTKFTLLLADLPAGYVCRINRTDPLYLPEEADAINIKLLNILQVVFKARLTMEKTNRLVSLSDDPVSNIRDTIPEKLVLPSFNVEVIKNKRQRTSE